MNHAGLTVVAIAHIAVVGLVALDTIKEGCCTSAQAQTPTGSLDPTVWDHNGSVMYLVANGPSREFYYQKPRTGMLEVGVSPGALLFRGEVDNGQYSGTAYIFNLNCGQIPFKVKGSILDSDERIVLTGQAPRVGPNCRVHETSASNLEFRRVKSNEKAQSKEQITATTAPRVEESKLEVPPTAGGELPSVSTAQPPAGAGSTSQGASVYVAGKGKYCKEIEVSGYLDCFYANSDACQKHNRSPNTRCVPNPNSGT